MRSFIRGFLIGSGNSVGGGCCGGAVGGNGQFGEKSTLEDPYISLRRPVFVRQGNRVKWRKCENIP